MSKRFTIHSDPYDCGRKMFTKNTLFLKENTISCLIGCNGSGKSTVLMLIKGQLHNRNAYEIKGKYLDLRGIFGDNKYNDEMYIDFHKNFESFDNEEDTFMKKFRDMELSTGESLSAKFGDSLKLIGKTIRDPNNKNKSLYIFIDDADAGTSIDLINDIKSIFNLIIKDCKQNNITCYIILTANSYELCKDIDCISVHDFEHKHFDSYEQYKEFVLESRKFKDKELE